MNQVIARPHVAVINTLEERDKTGSTQIPLYQHARCQCDALILADMSASLCVQAHLRELLEQGHEVAVVRDATAATMQCSGSRRRTEASRENRISGIVLRIVGNNRTAKSRSSALNLNKFFRKFVIITKEKVCNQNQTKKFRT